MDRSPLYYSLKNIPIPLNRTYMKTLISKTEDFIQRLRWKVLFFLQKQKDDNSDNSDLDEPLPETFGFRTEKTAPQQKDLISFENDLVSAISNIKFSRQNDDFQNRLQNDIKKISASENLFVTADKTSNIYEVKPEIYCKLLNNNVTSYYSKCNTAIEDEINNEAASIAKKFNIEQRVEKMSRKNAYITLKDHKDNFNNNPKCRLINPMKSNIGKISKVILQKANEGIRKTTKLNQWRSTADATKWFQDINNSNKDLRFVQFDIIEFYPTITEKLFNDALKFASKVYRFSKLELDTIRNSRAALLFHNNDLWKKKDKLFDVTMGAYDGAEVAETVGLYLLHKVSSKFKCLDLGLYRDDGLGTHHHLPGPEATKITKEITAMFKKLGLRITIAMNLTIVDFLDITMDIENKEYWPYRKPNSDILYINTKSNHPPAVIKNLPKAVSNRLSQISCNKSKFNNAKPMYESALKNSGFDFDLKFVKNEPTQKKNRTRKIIWYNPPYNAAITCNFGKIFLSLIEKHFPKAHKLHKIINKKTVKLSYSCMPNMKKIMQNHNQKVLNKPPEENEKTCNCNKTNKPNCPLNGNCLVKSVIYEAKIKTNTEEAFYIGSTENTFKERFTGHRQSFKQENKRNSTLLSKFVWKHKLNPNPNIEWKIIKQSIPYRPGSRTCNVCLDEKYNIISHSKNPCLLNKRDELATVCPHKNKYRFGRFKNVKRKA